MNQDVNPLYKVITLDQGSLEWLKYRQSKIGASDCPKIMQESPYGTPYTLWLDKMGLGENKSNAAMQEGTRLEPMIREKVSEIFNASPIRPVVIESIEYPWICASLDGMDTDGFIIEIKTANSEDHDLAHKCIVPKKYVAQLQHQLFVSGNKSMFYCSYHQKMDDLKLILVERDQDYIDKMLVKLTEFYGYMTDFVAPPLTDQDYIMRNDSEFIDTIHEYQHSKAMREKYEDLEQKTRAKLISLCNNRNTRCGSFKVSKVISKGRIDYTEATRVENLNLEKYRKPANESWRITV